MGLMFLALSPLTKVGGLSPLPLQAEPFVSGSKSTSQNVIANCELRIANWFNMNPFSQSSPNDATVGRLLDLHLYN
jgi:hypothetical protein